MRIEDTKLEGVKIVQLDEFEDHRGTFVELFNEKEYQKLGIDTRFIQDDISTSRRNVLRGLHGDDGTCKLISCLFGEIYYLVVNNDPESAQYRQWISFTLSDRNRKQVFIPPKFGNGHLVMSEVAVFHYKQSAYYNPTGQFTIKWNDPDYNFWWPVKDPILSQRDDFGGYV